MSFLCPACGGGWEPGHFCVEIADAFHGGAPVNPPIPARHWHPATCLHKWCDCYAPSSHEKEGDCRHCRKDKFNAKQADATVRHPEG